MNNKDIDFLAVSGKINSVVPVSSNPFYIVTPPYTRISAGVTVLHLLCHYLNMAGHNAYIVHYPPEQVPIRSLPAYVTLQGSKEYPGGMLAPLITHDIIDYYDSLRLTPIVIYPEVFDNPLNASFFGRYLLNYPGKLSAKYQEREQFNFAYTQILADHSTAEYPSHPSVNDVLFVPTVDLGFWNKSGSTVRSGSCFYAGKMRAIHGRAPENVAPGSVEILRGDQMTRDEIRHIFWKSEVFYCYEDTALAIEAQLCGCPTVFVKNDLFQGRGLASAELTDAGSCSVDEVGGITRAKATIGEFEAVIRGHMGDVPAKIAELGAKWKAMAQAQPYQGTIKYPFEARLVFFDRSLPMGVGFSDDMIGHMPVTRQGRISRILYGSMLLVAGTIRSHGISGAAKRAIKGLLRHGPLGFLKILHRTGL